MEFEIFQKVVEEYRMQYGCYPDEFGMKRISSSIIFTLQQVSKSNFVTIDEQYEAGLQILMKKLEILEKDFNKLVLLKLPFDNDRYQKVMEIHIPNFISNYDLHFDAVSVIYDYDYSLIDGIPLYSDLIELNGVDLVSEYVNRMLVEHQFLSLYYDQLPHFIDCYEAQYGISVKFLNLSLVDVVIRNIVVNINIKNDIRTLIHTNNQVDFTVNPELFLECIKNEYYYYDYFSNHFLEIRAIFEIANMLGCVTNYYVSENEKTKIELTNNFEFDFEEFNAKINNWEKSRDIEIFKEQMSIFELIALLDLNLEDVNYFDLFDQLDLKVVSAILKILTPESFAFNQKPKISKSWARGLSLQNYWEEQLINYIQKIPLNKKETILDFASKINYEMMPVESTE